MLCYDKLGKLKQMERIGRKKKEVEFTIALKTCGSQKISFKQTK